MHKLLLKLLRCWSTTIISATTSPDSIKNLPSVGKMGENTACGYLVKKRYRILARNYREKWDEIDIIAISVNSVLTFVEVKALTDLGGFGPRMEPEDHMTASKLKRLRRACRMFAAKHPRLVNNESGWQIDLIAIVLVCGTDTEKLLIRHYENI